MALDSSMLMQGKPIDIGGAIQQGSTARLQSIKAQEASTEQADTMNDTNVVKSYLAEPDSDIYTSTGLDKALKDLKGKVSVKTYESLADRRTKAQSAEAAYKNLTLKADDAALARETDDLEFILSNLAPVVGEKDPNLRKQKLEDTLNSVKGMTRADGKTPRVPPTVIESVRNAPPQVLDALYNTSKAKKTIIDLAKEEAGIKRTEAQTAALEGLGPTEEWVTPDGEQYLKGTKNGKTVKVESDGSFTPVPVLPTGATKLGSKVDGAVAKQKAAAELLDFDKNPPTPAEETMARTYMVSRKMESLGQNSPLRPRIAMLAAKLATDEGRSVLADNAVYKAESANAANLTKQYGVIKAGEQTVLGNLELMKDLIKKVDATGVPVLERWVRAGKRAIAGDPDVTKLDALIQSTQADIGKVLSASTGAAGIPVEALKKAQKYMGENLTADQFDALYDIVPKEMAVRTDKMEEQIAKSMDKVRGLTAKPGAKAAEPTPKEGELSIEDARKELQTARQKVRETSDPEQKRLATAVVRDLEAKIEALGKGGSKPAEGGSKPKVTFSGW